MHTIINETFTKHLGLMRQHLKLIDEDAAALDNLKYKKVGSGILGLHFVGLKDLNVDQRQVLRDLLNNADIHDEFAGGNYVKGEDKDQQRVVALLDDEVVGFMTPRFQPESGFWRSGAIYVSPQHQGKGIASTMLQKFFNDREHLPARVWIANKNTSSQKAFTKAGFERHKERNLSDSSNDQGFDWVKVYS